ncbi:GlxA family transcriptional regulator [Acanthopleuribacter pedis]|uniref:DJ-1/PfpI family protein n=1 Tax=Acanthopleuribacter pedis TaxID=442870 RepID=A0A8J7U2S5_9BACT|nr:DJ-1/PfpI family protein [Acanthopleuribacter pedis]MBO1319623.1 DJ-1/PfpI family protein [Acanthopleuribacter pedis]
MNTKRRILFVIYPGFEILDMSGPASVFANTNDRIEQSGYEIVAVSVDGGLVTSGAGLGVQAVAFAQITLRADDTLLVVGGDREPLVAAARDWRLLARLIESVPVVARFGSICSGAFILAEAGLLDGRRVTTHWLGLAEMLRRHPRVQTETEALYVADGNLWTSAGVTTGIDMALAMVAEDHGPAAMGRVARALVVYAHRPGNQSQFSTLLADQLSAGHPFAALPPWLAANLHRPLRVEDMAVEMGMSERSFYRRFTAAFGLTPSKYLEKIRLARAKTLLEQQMGIKAVAEAVGFKSEAAFRGAFSKSFGLSPSMHQRLHRRDAAQSVPAS